MREINGIVSFTVGSFFSFFLRQSLAMYFRQVGWASVHCVAQIGYSKGSFCLSMASCDRFLNINGTLDHTLFVWWEQCKNLTITSL